MIFNVVPEDLEFPLKHTQYASMPNFGVMEIPGWHRKLGIPLASHGTHPVKHRLVQGFGPIHAIC